MYHIRHLLWSRSHGMRMGKAPRRPRCLPLRLEALEDRCLPAPMTFTVTTDKDNGDNVHPTAGSLRAAILAANANTGFTNTIDFKIPSGGGGFEHVIQPPTPLPPITNPVVINGYSQFASSPNTNPSGSDDAFIEIEIDGILAPAASNGLDIAAGGAGTIIKGLVIGDWGVGIHVDASSVAITGDSIGKDFQNPSIDIGNGIGISLLANGNTVGGANATARNIISGNEDGVVVAGAGLNTVEGNLIGTDNSAKAGAGNSTGVLLIDGAMNTVGGMAPGDVNVISANLVAGVVIQGGNKNVLERNLIGTDSTGAAPLGNGSFGVVLITGTSANTIGGTSAGAANVISANGAQGVVIQGATKNLLEGNMIGTNSLGTKALGNGSVAVLITNGSSGNTIGGAMLGAGNLLSGQHFGVDIRGASNNLVEGNFIGTNVLGDAALPNFQDGVKIEAGSTGNIVGGAGLPQAPGLAGPNPAAGNLISGNGIGVEISDGGTTKNIVQGNLIGTNLGGDAALSNGGGVAFDNGASGNTVGGLTPPSSAPQDVVGNVISGSLTDGVGMVSGTSGNLVEGNFIGTNEAGTVAVPNGLDGVFCIDTSANTVGGTAAGAGNVISGNRNGVGMEAGSGNLVLGNRIGCNAAGTSALPNSGDGIFIEAIGGGNTVGGTAAGAGNIISGNTGDGVHMFAVTSKNFVEGNLIGLTPTVTLPNDFGVVISGGASANRIGGTTPAAGNVISGNANDGVLISDSGTTGNLVQGNRIGTDMSGELGAGNAQYGVVLSAAVRNTVGGTGQGAGNLISGNHAGGVELIGSADHNQVAANSIGTDKMGKFSVANLTDGVDIFGGTNNLIGGKGGFGPTGQGNLISGNDRDGVRISGETSSGNVVAGNWIGTNITGSTGLGNVGHGVFVFAGAHDNHVGSATGIGNVIAFNQQNGVVVGGSASDVGAIHNAILFNSIFSDGSLGIDLGNNGVTMNTNPSPHSGPNRFQNFPVIVQAGATASSTTFAATLDSIPSQSFVVQFFASPMPGALGYGEGQTLLATTTLPTNASGSGDVTLTLPQNLAGQWVSATATDSADDTSEFSKALQVKKIAGLSTAGTFMPPMSALPRTQPEIVAPPLGEAPISAHNPAPASALAEWLAMGKPGPSEVPSPDPGAARPVSATDELDDFFMIWGSMTQPAALVVG
jgi:Right handed beta helix region